MRKYVGGVTIQDQDIMLDYFVLENHLVHGIEIRQTTGRDTESVSVYLANKSSSEITSLAKCYMEHTVFPISLPELVEDYLAEQPTLS